MRYHLLLFASCLTLTSLHGRIEAQEGRLNDPRAAVVGKDKSGLLAHDLFGREINSHGLILVDWEGYIANPAIKFYLTPPEDAVFPAKAVLTAKEPRLHFDLPSTVGAKGPRKEIVWQKREKVPVHVSIFPDRDGDDEDHELKIEFSDAGGQNQRLDLPVRVIDQDRKRDEEFSITVDFGQDKTEFFADEAARAIVLQAAKDWSYFFADMKLQSVPAKSEKTLIWGSDGFKTRSQVLNGKEYTGYLLYAYGIRNQLQNTDQSNTPFGKSMNRDPAARNIRSGGEPSPYGGFQVSAGKKTQLRRSGGLEVEVQGNYNTLGWQIKLDDSEWWRATNLVNVKNDLYSIVHHEIGHALIFNPNNSLVKRGAAPDSDRFRAYLDGKAALNQSDHLDGVIDPESLHGAFGNEYHGKMPRCRWLITKLDLLFAEAIGYELRQTSSFTTLSLATDRLPRGKAGVPYSLKLKASGGIPFYCWEVIGKLPTGLALNSFTGEISGTPTQAGATEITVRVRDYSEKSKGVTKQLSLAIEPGK